MEDFGWRVLEISIPVIGAVVLWALGQLARWLSSRTTNEQLRALIAQANDAVATAVASVQQTYVDALKAGGGALTVAQREIAFQRALSAAKAVMGTKGMETLQSALALGKDEVEAWLTQKIEAAVSNRKPVTP